MKDWKKVKLGSLLAESKIVSETPDTDKRLRVRLNMLGVEKRPKTNDKEGATKYYIRKAGQFIYGKQNLHKGAFGIIPEELDGFESSSDIPAFDVHESCYPEWIYYFFKKGNFYAKLEGLAKGVGSKRIHPTQIFELDIYLPDKNEQKEILKNISDIEAKYKAILSETECQESWLFKLHQSVFDEAIKGTLTEEWRKNNNIGEVHKLLHNFKIAKDIYIKEGKIRPEKTLVPITANDIPFSIPESWHWCKLDDIVSIVGGVTKGKKPMGEMMLTPYLRVANVQRGFLDVTEIKEILVSLSDYNKYQLEKNDILIIEGGDRDKVGRGAIWKEEVPGCIYQNHIFRLRPFNRKQLVEEYINMAINSNLGRNYFENNAKQATNLASISKTVVRNFILPIPSFNEQEIIVQKVNEFAVFFDELKSEIQNTKHKIADMLQTILIQFLGKEYTNVINVEIKPKDVIFVQRDIKYDDNTTLMELIDLLKEHGKLHAEDLWKMSKHFDNKNIDDSIDKFYADLKKKIEVDKAIKEVENEKGYLELV